jgi:small membrane protein
MSVIQILILVFALFAVVRAVMQFKNGALTIAWLFFWILFWAAAGFVAIMPQTTDVVAAFFGVGRGADAVIYIALILLFLLVFRMYVHIEEVEGELTQLVRKLATKDIKEDKQD